MNKIHWFFVILCLLFISILIIGCDERQPIPPITEGGYEQIHPNVLPHNAKVVEDLGNGWILFRLELFGEERYFIIKDESDRSGEESWAIQPFTEVNPPQDVSQK